MVKVTQADFEAAEDYGVAIACGKITPAEAFAAHRLAAYAPEVLTPEVVEAALYEFMRSGGTEEHGMKAAILAAFATLGGAK